MDQEEIYAKVTSAIMEALEEGVVPWHQPWAGMGPPANLISGKEYRGVNPLTLRTVALIRGYESRWWLTFKQAKDLGGYVRKGESASPVVFWKWYKSEELRETGDGEEELVEERHAMIRYYSVFNTEQCEGIEVPEDKTPNPEAKPIAACEQVVSGYPEPPSITNGGVVACYRPRDDEVKMPAPERFLSDEHFYATLFHELTHSTGHPSRLARINCDALKPFGTEDYSFEELTAEMGAAFLCATVGIDVAPVTENTAAYIAGWRKRLSGENRELVYAAQRAQKAVDYILNRRENDDE